MNVSKRTRGAVSVFLVMILVPCIVVTSVFVDLGRVHMSKSMAYSASDLALNSLLTNYDADLNEWYGMVTSCQNIEEFYEVSAQFFLRTISSRGLSDDEIFLLSDYYAHATNDDTIFDLLQIECQTAPSDMISEVSGANLSNAAMIKDQTVEFMKYRAPIEITTQLIDRLKSDSTVTQAFEAEENKPLVENKSNYYEAEGELLAAAFNSYVAIYDYYRSATTGNLTNEKLTGYADKLNHYKSVYQEIHNFYVSNLSNTSGLSQYSRVAIKIDEYNDVYDKTHTDVYTTKKTVGGEEKYYINKEDLEDLIEELSNKITDFNTAKTNFENAAASLMGNLPGSGDSQSNTIQWWVQMNKAVNSSNGHTKKYKDAAIAMLKAYSKVLAIDQCEKEDDVPSTWKDDYDYEEITDQVEAIQEKYLKAGVTSSSDAYLKAVKKLEDVSASNKNKIISSNLYVTVDGESKNIDNAIPYIKGQLASIRSDLSNYIEFLDIAIDGNEGDNSIEEHAKVKSLDKLLTLASNYDTALLTWTNTANGTATTMGEEDRDEIANIQQVCQEINEDSVRVLKTRLTNIRSQLKSIVTAIDSMKYGNVNVKSLADYSTFKSKAQTKVSSASIPLKNSDLKTYASNTFGQLFKPTSAVISLEHVSDSNYNPKIDPITKQVNTPDLFVYFHNQFQGLSKQDVVEKQNELDSGEAVGNDKAKEAKEKGRYHGGGADIVKDFSKNGTFNLADGAISGVMDLFESLINLDITSIRDDLYVTSYIMNMFSYATYENEGLYGLVETKTDLTLANYATKYNEVMGTGTDDEGTWLSGKPKDNYNKSLTNKLINKNNNSAYCAEVEYILYGGRDGKGNNDNVKSVYSNIYGIRYALNLVSGFSNFWTYGSNNTADVMYYIGLAIQTATSGIIPIPLTKVVLIPIITAFETSKDLDRLEAGFPVELYKTSSDQWWVKVPDGSTACGISGFTSVLNGTFNGPNTDKGLFYSDYLTAFVYLGLKGSSAEAMYQRMAEVMQTNMRKLTNVSSYSMKKARLYFKLNATIRVSPLMITLPFFNDDDYDNNMDTKTDWCTYQISTVRGYS